MLESTGERLIPAASAGELVHAEHVARYRLAARLAVGRRVLDAACGEGYGSALLAAAGAGEVEGVDIDEATVAHARGSYGMDFRVADVADLPFEKGAFGLVVSFETIEHVAEPERALDEFARVLAEDGALLISTPNAAEYRDDNPFHVREFRPTEFAQALESRFPYVRYLYQQNFIASAILDPQRLAEADGRRTVELEVAKVAGTTPDRALYLLALCSRRPVPALEADVTVLADIYEAHQLADRLRNWMARADQAEHNQREWEARAREAERQNEQFRVTLNSKAWRAIEPLRRARAAVRRTGR